MPRLLCGVYQRVYLKGVHSGKRRCPGKAAPRYRKAAGQHGDPMLPYFLFGDVEMAAFRAVFLDK